MRVNRHVLERQSWEKFGDCKGLPRGPEQNITYQSFEIIHLDLRPKKREEEKDDGALESKLSGTSSIVVCRNWSVASPLPATVRKRMCPRSDVVCSSSLICLLLLICVWVASFVVLVSVGSALCASVSVLVVRLFSGETGHWTLKCPKRQNIDAFANKPSLAASLADKPEMNASGGSKYVPLHARPGAKPVQTLGRDDAYTVRVTNLSEEVTEGDLQDLFARFGHCQRIYLAKDRQTGESRGFAFINFTNRKDGQAAIDKLNGHGYANLILHVEWAKPREERPEREE